MGFYLNKTSTGILPPIGKVEKLIADGAVLTDGEKFEDNLVCVVLNHKPVFTSKPFEAAVYVYSESEFESVKEPDTGEQRKRTWLIYPHAKELAQ
jgi:hypothetical protein